jgi:peptidyl-prolyl cis-trans isomerase A (cyclophilin A)
MIPGRHAPYSRPTRSLQQSARASGLRRFGPRPALGLALGMLLAACSGEPARPALEPGDLEWLLRPALFEEPAPDEYRVRVQTTEGDFVIAVHREWAPLGAERFYNLVRAGFYDGQPFYRVVEGQWAQWGLHPDPWVNVVWREEYLMDDENRGIENTRGRVSFASAGRDARSVHVFVNLGDNRNPLDEDFTPFGEVVEGMDVVDALYAGYGDGPPRGDGVYQAMAEAKGDEYFAEFPELDRIVQARIETSSEDEG